MSHEITNYFRSDVLTDGRTFVALPTVSIVSLQRCGACRKWKKGKHYDCQHNGPWGGCSAKGETKFEPKKVRAIKDK